MASRGEHREFSTGRGGSALPAEQACSFGGGLIPRSFGGADVPEERAEEDEAGQEQQPGDQHPRLVKVRVRAGIRVRVCKGIRVRVRVRV